MRLDDVTIVLPTKNEEGNILPFLHSVHPDVALVVVDSSDDKTADLVVAHRPERTHVLRQAANVTEARQIGARAAQTDWLLFSDADISFAPDYFQVLRTHSGDADVIYGAKASSGEYAGYYQWFVWGQGVLQRLGIPGASGSNLLIRRDVFWQVGGFDLNLTVNEDSEIAWRIARRGYRVMFARDLVVCERDHRRLRRGVLRKTLHSFLRCTLLYLNLIPEQHRARDWGYWSAGGRSGRE